MIPVCRIRSLLGLHGWKKTTGLDLGAICKQRIIEARKAGDDNRAAELSQVKQTIKKRIRSHCIDCGQPCGSGGTPAVRCGMCARRHRNYGKALPA